MRNTRRRVATPPLLFYGVASVDDEVGTGLPPATTRLVFRDIAAVVETAPPAMGDLDLERYTEVVTHVFERLPILPARPGTVFQTRDLLAQWLELHYFTLAEALAFVTDRGVARVTLSDAEATTPDAVEPPTVLEAKTAEVLRVLRRHAAAHLALPESKGEEGASRHSFLVERERWDVFAETVQQEDERHSALTLALTGPWPAYDFVRMDFGG